MKYVMGCVPFSLAYDSNIALGSLLMRKPTPRTTSNWLKTTEVASILGISSRTLLRKLAAGKVEEPARDPKNNYRLWRPEEVEAIHQQILREKV
jgi:predicted DNA-binding transcriptional regulator AlpA